MIQAQLDAAERRERERERNSSQEEAPSPSATPTNDADSDSNEDHEDERASKRRRTSREGSVEVPVEEQKTTEPESDALPTRNDDALFLPPLRPADLTTPLRAEPRYFPALATSPLSSPPGDFRSSVYRPRHFDLLRSSSPLSSLPALMSDPFAACDSDTDTPSRRSSVSESGSEEAEDSFVSSTSRRLPNMKGKDLFDASIWADPLRTKVFYTFATTLRQKSRDCVPTASHQFISHLKKRGKLVRCYTQNIDRIEEKVGLSTELQDGPGSRGRFRKSTSSNAQLAKMVEEAKDSPPSSQPPSSQPPSSQPPASQLSASQPSLSSQPSGDGDAKSAGVECVYLHGSLEQLRCFQCKRTSSWDEMEDETLSGQQPECPHCVQATVAREEKGKRALGVGKLRPDIVLYGEEHPSYHLIGPIVEHDIKLCRGADMLLILGTSLKVHGLKFLVREFANALHNKNGKVVFVNFTKPPESIWSDIIDYWVQWDCDAWVADLQARVPKLWEAPQAPKDKISQPPKQKPPPANPVAFRDTRWTGAFWTRKIHDELSRITGTQMQWKTKEDEKKLIEPVVESVVEALPAPAETLTVRSELQVASGGTEAILDIKVETQAQNKAKTKPKPKSTKPRKPRKSAPAALQQPTPQPSSSPSSSQTPPESITDDHLPSIRDAADQLSSILHSVKENPRVRKRKKLDGEEVVLPTVASRSHRHTLAPIVNSQLPTSPQDDTRPKPLEPTSPPSGPTQTLSSNLGASCGFVGRFFQSGVQQVTNRFFASQESWFGAKTGFGGGMVHTTSGPYQFGAGLQPSRQQVAPPEVSRVDAQRHDGRDNEAALAMTQMRSSRRRTKMPR